MKIFRCVCGNRIYFENNVCEQCQRQLGFVPEQLAMSGIDPAGDNEFLLADDVSGNARYRQCDNYRYDATCNWLVAVSDVSIYCRACRLNQTIPDLSITENRIRWYRIEDAKRRLLYTLFRLRLPVIGRDEDPENGLAFDFLSDQGGGPKVFTGHENGLITINVAEADPSQREEIREQLGERHRTLLGHFRHEIGHFYWDRLVAHSHWLPPFRACFGDERIDYDTCKNNYYVQGAQQDWDEHFITAYASMHPWEDWAETWAHYLHLTDTLETAADHQLSLRESAMGTPPLLRNPFSPKARGRTAFMQQINDWGSLALAMNAINRSMGMPDPYPFVLSNATLEKMFFVHRVIAHETQHGNRA